MSDIPPEKTAYRSALLWAFDRLSVSSGMTLREQRYTMEQIGNVLCGKPSPAGTYEPADHEDSQVMLRRRR